MDEGVRFDGRRVDEVRPILVDQEVLPVVHGSALFSRGDTQVRRLMQQLVLSL